MSGDKINLKIERKDGITQALKKLVESVGGQVNSSIWGATIDKLEEINTQRKTNGGNSIFSGGTQRSDWPHNFVVHEGNIEFSKDEMSALCDVMQISAEAKAKILGAGTEPPTQKNPEEEATKLGYRKTNHSGTYYDDKTKTHYQWDAENQKFVERKDIGHIKEDGSYTGTDGVEYNADGTPKANAPATPKETPKARASEDTTKVEKTEGVDEVEEAEETDGTEENNDETQPPATERAAIEKSIIDAIHGAEIEVKGVDDAGRPTKGIFKNGTLWVGNQHLKPNNFTVTYNEDGSYYVKVYNVDNEVNAEITYNTINKVIDSVTTIGKETKKEFYTYGENGNKATAKVERYSDEKIKWSEERKYDSQEREVEYIENIYNDNGEVSAHVSTKYTYITDAQDSPRKFEREGFGTDGSHTEIGQNEKEGSDWYTRNSITTTTLNDGTKSYEAYVDLSVNMNTYINLAAANIETNSLEEAQEYEKQLLHLKDIYHELSRGECSEATKEKYKSELISIIKDENTHIKVRQRAVFVANYGLGSDSNKDVMDEIIETKNSRLIGCCLCGNHDWMGALSSYSPEQLDKIYEITANKEFTDIESYEKWYDNGLLLDIAQGLIANGTEEQKLRAFNAFHTQTIEFYPNLSLEFITENWNNIPENCRLKMLANQARMTHNGNAVGTVLEKESFENFVLPLLPQPPKDTDVQLLKEVMRLCLRKEDLESYHLVESGDRFHNIIRDYMLANLEKTFPKVAAKTNWDDARKREAVNKYVLDFGTQIAKEVGLDNPNNLYPGQVIDFSKIEWREPAWYNWAFWY